MQRILIVGLVIYLAASALLFTPAPPLPDGSIPVPTHESLHLAPDAAARADAEVVLAARPGAPGGRWWLADGRLYEPADATSSDANASDRPRLTITRHRYLYDSRCDLGTVAACGLSGDLARFQVGIRASPVRLFYGVLSADVVITRDGAGLGAACYPPADYFGRWWNHCGVGAWYVVPFDGGRPALCIGLSFSTLP